MKPSAIRLSLCALALAAATVVPADARSLHAAADRPSVFRRFLQHYLATRSDDADDLRRTRYAVAFADLNGDGAKEAIVYVSGPEWCGSGGCNAYVFTPVRGGYRRVMSTTVTRPPIRLLSASHHGWRDIGVFVAGGGALPGYEAALSFDGKRYPSNPSMAPARPLHGAAGRVLISANDQGQPLYP